MGERKNHQSQFVDLYAILDVAPDAETAQILRRIQQCYSHAQQNLHHTNAHQRLHAQQLFHVYLPQARQVLLCEASRAAYDLQRERALASTHNASTTADDARRDDARREEARREEARITREIRAYSINRALDQTLVTALMATTLLFLIDVIWTSLDNYPLGIPRAVAIGLGITLIAFGLVWHFQALRRRVMHQMQRAINKNATALHQQSEQCKRAACIEGAVLLVGLSAINALDERFLSGGYPLGSRLLFNSCMALVLTVVFFAGRQVCIHAKNPAKARDIVKTRKL